MNAGHPRPSRLVIWLLAAISSHTPSEAVVGDILEELDERHASGRAPRFPRLWLNLQVLRFAAAAAATAAPSSLRSAGHTIRDAARALWRAPAHALFILLVLAVGISAATVTFSVVDAVVFKPLPFDHSEEIVMVTARNARGFSGFTVDQFWAIHDRVPGLDGVATMMSFKTPIEAAGVKEETVVMRTMADLFRVLRLKPLQGRLWTPDDEARDDTAIAVIGHALWQRRFGGDPAAIGQFIRVKDTLHRIVGILPADAVMPETRDWSVDIWVPQARVTDANTGSVFSALARIRSGVSLPQVATQIASVTTPLISATQAARPDWRPEVKRWDEALVGDVRSYLMLLLGTVSLIVLIACFNAANLMLTRSAQRARELAVRASLGASRRQLAMTLLVESLMLSSAACLCGLVFATWGVDAVKTGLPITLFRAESIGVNGRVFAAAMAAALVTGVLFGTVPAWQASRVSVVSLLKDGGTTATGARRRWRSVFLTAEIACIGILLVVSTLFVTSFVRAATLDLGFDRSNLIGVSTIEGFAGTVEDVRTRVAQIPGVTGVAAVGTTSLPLVGVFGGAYIDSPLTPVNTGAAAAASADVELYRVSPNYFDIMSIPFRRGSTWSYTGSSDFQPMVVDEVAARVMFGDRDPIGQQVRAKDLNDRVFTIVGTVPFVLPHGPEQSTSASQFHTRSTAYYQMVPTSKPNWVSLLVRTGPPPALVAGAVEATLASVAPASKSGGAGVHLFDDGFRVMTAKRRFNASLMAVFAIFAMFIGAAGIFAVMASVVAQQTKEIGVRVALGATPGRIQRGVLEMAGRHLLIGLAVGLPAAWLMSRGFEALFFQVQPGDPVIYAIVAVLLAAISVAGAVIPARRAARVDPMVSLRA